MATPTLAPRMTAEDAAFLYLERKELGLHIGSVAVLDGPVPFEALVASLDARLHLIPRYRQRVIPAPFNIGHPSWEDDPNFDIKNHVIRLWIDAPGDDAVLRAISGKLFSQLLDRKKPLWEIYVIEGLEHGRTALLSKTHHCMVDGVSGVALMSLLLDTSREMHLPEAKPRFAPPPIPGPAQLYFKALAANFQQGLERLGAIQTESANMLQAFASASTAQAMLQVAPLLAELARPADRLPFNKPCSGEREITWAEFPFGEARAIRGAIGGTVNDVALTVLTGAVSRYVKMCGDSVSRKFCRYMVPVNVRREDQRADLGNQVSALMVNVPLDIEDSGERLKVIHRRMETLKNARLSDLLRMFTTLAGAAPAPLQAMIGALPFVRFGAPIFNMVATNVPGPQIPLYACGHEMLHYYPHVPVGNDMGMGCAIQSYNQKLAFGITSDRAAAPQAQAMQNFLRESFADLHRAAGLTESQHVAPTPVYKKKKAKATDTSAVLVDSSHAVATT